MRKGIKRIRRTLEYRGIRYALAVRPKAAGGACSSDGVEEADADPGDFQYDWDKRDKARERAFPPPQAATPTPAPAPVPACVADPTLDESDGSE